MRTVLAVTAVFATLALLWQAGEAHYKGCVDRVGVLRDAKAGQDGWGPPPYKQGFAYDNTSTAKLRHALNDCSRLPF